MMMKVAQLSEQGSITLTQLRQSITQNVCSEVDVFETVQWKSVWLRIISLKTIFTDTGEFIQSTIAKWKQCKHCATADQIQSIYWRMWNMVLTVFTRLVILLSVALNLNLAVLLQVCLYYCAFWLAFTCMQQAPSDHISYLQSLST